MCDVESYIYMPLLEEIGYMPKHKYSYGPELRQHAVNIAAHFNLTDKALFQAQITSMDWDDAQKAFEDGSSRPDGLIRGMVDLWLWMDVVKVVWHGVSNVVLDRVWGGEGRATRMINASVMYINTGQLKNMPQVAEI